MGRFLKWIALGLVALLAAIQFYPPAVRDNPPVTGEIQAPPEVMTILRRSCYDCHSNETRWPWYSQVAPVSWFVTGHVRHARAEMNFSAWEQVPATYRVRYRGEIVKQVGEGRMPPASYLRMHRGARVSPEELETLRRWTAGGGGEGEDPPPP